MTRSQEHLDRARRNKRESKNLDFKEHFDPSSTGEWCELLKDLVAMANSGGGVIVVGAKNNGDPAGTDAGPTLKLDLAVISDKVLKYTGEHFAGVEIHEVKRRRSTVAAMVVDGAPVPLIFIRPGTYEVATEDKKPKPKQAFQAGAVYVRHGAKSEPATTRDLFDVIERRVDELRQLWLGGIRQVVEAPADANVAVYRPTERDEAGRPTKVRLTTEPGAPVYGMIDPDETHPYRETELIREVNSRLPKRPKRRRINHYDAQAVRAVHKIDGVNAPQFAHKPKFGSMQFSDGFADWLLERIKKDADFLDRARQHYYEMRFKPTNQFH